ncbi:uncharacterized protein B0I36DRAFT_369704 [Microdochium trichocladiopsis]|uniref:Uncharacterized protein n=1 Tax=Microdochium trichocladiopsis TaxID=1682393 RepID=A0A9P8XR12_9PEZI|nr:uncharacterized protein B0I36DRAFT_369704 [Microdochium trichocladiopsis]KAH7012552.1 hypothetical protein B0I36DRAFT_369704 [Microdochium trichocladiopsis]
MRPPSVVVLTAGLAGLATGQSVNPATGFVGKGITMFRPTCASACRDSLSTYRLNCSTVIHDMQGSATRHDTSSRTPSANKRALNNGSVMFVTSPSCYATDTAYLQSVAYCINTRCPLDDSITRAVLEDCWYTYLVGRDAAQPEPAVSYSGALSHTAADSQWSVIGEDDILDRTTLSTDDVYLAKYNAEHYFELSEERHVDFGLVLFIAGLPIANVFLMPTRGQAIFILYLFALNTVLCAVGYTTTPRSDASSTTTSNNNAWFPTPSTELLSYIANRTGILCFANMPLIIIYMTGQAAQSSLSDRHTPSSEPPRVGCRPVPSLRKWCLGSWH